MPDPAVFRAIADYGLAIVVCVALGAFAFWLVRTGLDDLRKQRDAAIAGWQGQMAATAQLAAALNELSGLIRDRRRT